MCVCDATELEDDPDADLTFHQIEQSPSGVTWVFEANSGDIPADPSTLGYIDDNHDFVTVVPMIHGDGPETLSEIVSLDDTYLWVLGRGGIYRLLLSDLDTPGLEIQQGIGVVAFVEIGDYQFYFEVVHDFDVVDDFVWFIEDRILKKMHVTNMMGAPTVVADLEPDFGPIGFEEHDMLIATATDRLWITKMETNPTVRSYDFDGNLLEEVPIDSVSNATPTDMVVERDTEAVVLVGQASSVTGAGDFRADSAFRVFKGGSTCRVEVPTWTGLDGLEHGVAPDNWEAGFDPVGFGTRSVGHGATRGFVTSVQEGEPWEGG